MTLDSLWQKAYERVLGAVEHPLSKLRMRLLSNRYAGERCFIVGSAPSVKKLNLGLLNGEYVFTVNRGYLLKEFGLQHSNFHIIEDNNISCFYHELDFTFFDSIFLRDNIKTKSLRFLKYQYHRSPTMDTGVFQFDITDKIYRGCTVVLSALQIAVYMGFTRIYFIGVDLDYDPNDSHFYQPYQQELTTIMPTQKVLQGFACAHEILSAKAVHIYNAGIGGCLDTIPRVRYDELWDSSATGVLG